MKRAVRLAAIAACLFAAPASPETLNAADAWRIRDVRTGVAARLADGRTVTVSADSEMLVVRVEGEEVQSWPAEVLDLACIDPDGRGEPFLVAALRAGRGRGRLAWWRWENGGFAPGGSYAPEGYMPFMLRAGDVDDDGRTEILAGVYDPALGGRPGYSMKLHVFDVLERRLVPQWFSERRFEDFRVVNIGGRNRLLSVERHGAGSRVNLFAWDGFGFWLDETLFTSDVPVGIDHAAAGVVLEGRGRKVEVFESDDGFATRLIAGGNDDVDS